MQWCLIFPFFYRLFASFLRHGESSSIILRAYIHSGRRKGRGTWAPRARVSRSWQTRKKIRRETRTHFSVNSSSAFVNLLHRSRDAHPNPTSPLRNVPSGIASVRQFSVPQIVETFGSPAHRLPTVPRDSSSRDPADRTSQRWVESFSIYLSAF